MKTSHLFTLLFCMCVSENAHGASEGLVLLTPNGGPYYAGEELDITWQRPTVQRETVSLSILLLPEATPWEQFSKRTFIIAKDIRLEPATNAEPRGSWLWHIPSDIPPGVYRIEVIETQKSTFPFAWDRNDERIIIVPRPRIAFLTHREPERIRSGSSPEFRFAMEAWGTNKVQTFLMREKQVIGQLLGSRTYQGEGGSFTGTITWELTRYYDATGRHFAPPGEGYRVLIGILTEAGHAHNTDVFTAAFVSYDETAPFEIIGTPPLLSLQKLRGTAALTIYIVGEPLQEYAVSHSHTLVPAQWQEVWSDRTDADGVLGGVVNLRGTTVGFFRVKQLTTNLK